MCVFCGKLKCVVFKGLVVDLFVVLLVNGKNMLVGGYMVVLFIFNCDFFR